MATTFFLTDTTSDINPNSVVSRLASLSRGAGLATDVRNTDTGGAGVNKQMTDSAGGTLVEWFTKPLDAVTISGDIVLNWWMSENSMNANVTAAVVVDVVDNDGTNPLSVLTVVDDSNVELPVTTRAAQNWTVLAAAVTSQSITAGKRLRIQVWGGSNGTMGSGFTFDLGYGATSGGADGDSFVTFTETITEQAIADILRPNTFAQ